MPALNTWIPGWEQLTPAQQTRLSEAARPRAFSAGELIHNGDADCVGLLLVKSGRLRVFILSEDGREITLYRLLPGEICLFSASCMMPQIAFAVTVTAEAPSEVLVLPPDVYKAVMAESAPLANFTNELIAARFSDVMWLIEQILWKSFDRRLAAFLLAEAKLEHSATLHLTHEAIANHMGTAREVVTRMLRYFQGEGWVKLARGTLQLTDEPSLRALAE